MNDDKGKDVSMYKIFLFKMPLVIALGDIKYTFIDKKCFICTSIFSS